MNAVRQEVRAAWGRLTAAPAAMFVAVLTTGFALASTAHHLGLYNAGAMASKRGKVVLACPRTNAAKSTAAVAHAAGPNAAQTSPASAPHPGVPSEKHTAGKTGGSGLSVPLPDFNAPELSRFISPL
jgi:hypothetical protein